MLHPFIHTYPTYCRLWTHPALCDFNDDDSLRRTPCDDCEDKVIVYTTIQRQSFSLETMKIRDDVICDDVTYLCEIIVM